MIVIEKARISKSPKIEITNNIRRSDNSKKSGKSVNSKRRLAKKLTFSSTDSSEEEQKASPRKVKLKLTETKIKSFFSSYIFKRKTIFYLFYTAYAQFSDKRKCRSRRTITIYHDIKKAAKDRNILEYKNFT